MTHAVTGDAARLMDRMYDRQRHIYDASRKFYLLGRDGLIAGLLPPAGGSVLEIGCGTARNLIKTAQAYPTARCYGIDVSEKMLVTAQESVARAGLGPRIALAQADATDFDPGALFGQASFDRIVISYALSMIPPWQAVLDSACRHLAPGGALHIVDFGDQAELPRWFAAALTRWLALFEVTPRRDLADVVAKTAAARHMRGRVTQQFGGYAVHAVIDRF